MKKFFLILLSLIVLSAAALWFFVFHSGSKRPKGPKPVPLAVSKHSDNFNASIQQVLDDYYSMAESFVEWDNSAVTANAQKLRIALDSLKIDELKVDTTGLYESALDPLNNAKGELTNIISKPEIADKRIAFNSLSENLRLLFIVVKYDRAKLYWQECPMAFGEGKSGNWISKTDAVRNPYLGKKDPTYKDGMLTCGTPIDSINFVQVDTVGKREERR